MISHRKPLPRSKKPIARSAIKRKPRKPSETLRIYGGKKRIEFVKSLACVVCGYRGWQIENAHIKTGGTGRKADANWIVPLCGPHHAFLHRWARKTFEDTYGVDLNASAVETERLWQEHQGATA